MVVKPNPRVRNFLLIGMFLGFMIIAVGEVGDFALEIDVEFTGLEILQ